LQQRPTIKRFSSGWSGKRVGLLGGSFNPAHHGHHMISKLALKRLRLDAVWWLVSPQNPLKKAEDMASLKERVQSAQAAARLRQIHVSTIESELGTNYTVDTLRALRRQFAKTAFVWMMGADNLAQIPRWKDWQGIFHTMPIAIFSRPSYPLGAINSPAAQQFARYRIPANAAPTLVTRPAPAWCFFRDMTDPISATKVREQGSATAERS